MKTLFILVLVAASAVAQQSYDLVVYGGTAAGVMTAVSGARQGLKTVLLEPRDHVGGMVSGGLSGTDVGRREVIGGMAIEFSSPGGITGLIAICRRSRGCLSPRWPKRSCATC